MARAWITAKCNPHNLIETIENLEKESFDIFSIVTCEMGNDDLLVVAKKTV